VLESWNAGTAKAVITAFVARATDPCSEELVPPAERIAVFDNDGTLWCEQPIQSQGFFLADRVRDLAARDPSLKDKQPYKSFLEQDHATLHALGKKAIVELMMATHTGMSEGMFDGIAKAWFAGAKHPKLGRLFKHCTYRPQVELLEYLRGNGFKTYIVSGGGIDLIRAFAEEAYGIPREQVIGSSARLKFEAADRGGRLMKLAELNSFDDREAKPQNIGLHIGRRPILAFGNSDGDLAMMRYTLGGLGARIALLLHHDDAEREFAYDRDFKLSPLTVALDKAQEFGINVVSMKRDWKLVFGDP
jgi:haloacid dehalogenase-like hydrolase